MSEQKPDYFEKHYVNRYTGLDVFKIIHPHFINFHRMEVTRNYEYPKHRHDLYEVIWVDKGPYFCSINGIELEVNTNEVLVVQPGDFHQDHLKKGQSHYVMHFSLEYQLFSPTAKPVMQIGETCLQGASPIFDEIETAISASPDRFTGSLQDALLETLFWRIVRILPEDALSNTFTNYSFSQEFISRLYQVFYNSKNHSLSVESMADKMGISRRNLTMKCKIHLNESPGRLFLIYKIKQAEYQLIRENMTIKEISSDLGFDTPFNFSRAFKRITGISPSIYRQKKFAESL